MNRDKMLKEVKELVNDEHGGLKNLRVKVLTEPPSHWFQYHGRNASKFVNRWSVKTYPTGLKKKQIYLTIEADGFHKSIFDVTLENDGRLWLSSMGRWYS